MMSKKPEQKLWDELSPVFNRWKLDPVRVENGLDFGTPDVNYSKGWIELKSVTAPTWPRSPVDIGWQKGQKGWLGRRWQAGGMAFLLMKIQFQYLLIDGWTCCTLDGTEPLSHLVDLSLITSSSIFNRDLRLILQGEPSEMPNYLRARWYRAVARMTRLEAAHSLSMDCSRLIAGESGMDSGAAEDLVEAWEV